MAEWIDDTYLCHMLQWSDAILCEYIKKSGAIDTELNWSLEEEVLGTESETKESCPEIHQGEANEGNKKSKKKKKKKASFYFSKAKKKTKRSNPTLKVSFIYLFLNLSYVAIKKKEDPEEKGVQPKILVDTMHENMMNYVQLPSGATLDSFLVVNLIVIMFSRTNLPIFESRVKVTLN